MGLCCPMPPPSCHSCPRLPCRLSSSQAMAAARQAPTTPSSSKRPTASSRRAAESSSLRCLASCRLAALLPSQLRGARCKRARTGSRRLSDEAGRGQAGAVAVRARAGRLPCPLAFAGLQGRRGLCDVRRRLRIHGAACQASICPSCSLYLPMHPSCLYAAQPAGGSRHVSLQSHGRRAAPGARLALALKTRERLEAGGAADACKQQACHVAMRAPYLRSVLTGEGVIGGRWTKTTRCLSCSTSPRWARAAPSASSPRPSSRRANTRSASPIDPSTPTLDP